MLSHACTRPLRGCLLPEPARGPHPPRAEGGWLAGWLGHTMACHGPAAAAPHVVPTLNGHQMLLLMRCPRLCVATPTPTTFTWLGVVWPCGAQDSQYASRPGPTRYSTARTRIFSFFNTVFLIPYWSAIVKYR